MSILNVAFYRFAKLENLPEMRESLFAEAESLGLKGTILLSSEGMNGFLAGQEEPTDRFLSGLQKMPDLEDLIVKRSWTEQIPFEFLLIKLKKEIIAFGVPGVEPEKFTAPRLEPQELKRWLDEGRPVKLVDTRNGYEMALGAFEGALDLKLSTFKEFPEKWRIAAQSFAPGTPVVMYCTGGIRCEKATALAVQQGFPGPVYQLEGGILRYFEECGGAHYQGGCFVFDDRISLDPNLKAPEGMVQCRKCRAPWVTASVSVTGDCVACRSDLAAVSA
jgi:predicted sulfurtransferase